MVKSFLSIVWFVFVMQVYAQDSTVVTKDSVIVKPGIENMWSFHAGWGFDDWMDHVSYEQKLHRKTGFQVNMGTIYAQSQYEGHKYYQSNHPTKHLCFEKK